MPYFGIGYFSNDEKQINISHRWLQDMRTRTRNKLKPAAAFVTRLTLRALSLTRPHWLKIIPNDQMQAEKWCRRFLVTWRPLEWQWSDPGSTETLMTCDPPPPMSRGCSVTRRDNSLGKCWLIGRHADIISQGCDVSMEISSSFSCLYFARMGNLWDAEAFEVSMTLITRSELMRQGTRVKVTSNVYFHIWWYLHIGGGWGLEVGLLTYLSLKQMEKVSFSNPKCPFLHLGKLANTHVIALERIFLFKLLSLKRWPSFNT